MKLVPKRLQLVLTSALLAACASAAPGAAGPGEAIPDDAVPGEAGNSIGSGTGAQEQEAAPAPAPFDHTHAAWDAILREHVQGPLFDYAALAKRRAPFDSYLGELEAVSADQLAGWTKDQRFAFWINVYNAYTVRKVIDNLPLKSIRDLDKNLGLTNVFEQSWIPLNALHPSGKDKRLSLNDVEHEILRKRFPDARVHAAVNCASWSCPPLLGEAFVADRLDDQLTAQMRAFLADRDRNSFDTKKGVARVSRIFDWFKDDFVRDAGSVRDYLLRYAPADDQAFLRAAQVKFLDYDWKLNAPPAKD